MSTLLPLLALLLVGWMPAVRGDELGVVGPTYEIAERDLIEVMKDKFRRMEKSGELARLQENYRQRVIEAVEKPRPVHGVSTTETARTFYVDPTWTLDRNVVDEQGKRLFLAGTKVNPLDYAPLTQYLLFFDQREKAQVAFASMEMMESMMQMMMDRMSTPPASTPSKPSAK